MLETIGEVLTYTAGIILALYPVFVVLALDFLMLFAIAKEGGSHPFLTGMLFAFILNSRSSSYDSGSSYLALAILSPITAGLAVYLSFYLGMPLLGWILGLIPAGALVLLGVGVLMQYFGRSIEKGIGNLAGGFIDLTTEVAKIPQSLFGYLKDRGLVVSFGIILLLSATIGSGLLFYFGMTFAAYCLGFATAGTLALLTLGYLAKYFYDRRNDNLPMVLPPPAYDNNWGSPQFTQSQNLTHREVHPSVPPPSYDYQPAYNPLSAEGAAFTPQLGSVVEVL